MLREPVLVSPVSRSLRLLGCANELEGRRKMSASQTGLYIEEQAYNCNVEVRIERREEEMESERETRVREGARV